MPKAWFGGLVTLTAEAALSAATGSYGAWDSGLWDTATWGPDVLWTDISQWLKAPLTVDRRFGRDVQAWESGTCLPVFDNTDGRFSAGNLSGPYVTAGVTGIRPWRPFRLRATYGGITYPLYAGHTTDWTETWTRGPADIALGTATAPCQDEWARLAAFTGIAQEPVGDGETSGRRIHRILDAAGHAGTRTIANGVVSVQATTLEGSTTEQLQVVADSEGGACWVDADGTVMFDDRYALIEQARSNTVQAVFGDGTGGPDELPCANITVEYSGDRVANMAAMTRVGGVTQTAVDNTSRALYGDRQPSDAKRDNLICATDADAAGLADWYVQRYKDPELRISQIVVKPRRDPARLFPQVLGRRVRDLVRVVRRPPGGYTLTRDCFIAGIHHDITRGDWVTTFDLWSASPYTSYSTSRWDVATWDTSTFFI